MGTAWIPDQRRAILMCIQLLAWIGKGESWSGENSGKVHDTRDALEGRQRNTSSKGKGGIEGCEAPGERYCGNGGRGRRC